MSLLHQPPSKQVRPAPPMESPNQVEGKKPMRALIAGVTVCPDDERLEVEIRTIPAPVILQPGSSSFGLVAGGQSDHVQRNKILERFAYYPTPK